MATPDSDGHARTPGPAGPEVVSTQHTSSRPRGLIGWLGGRVPVLVCVGFMTLAVFRFLQIWATLAH